jgi:hypothetical protein
MFSIWLANESWFWYAILASVSFAQKGSRRRRPAPWKLLTIAMAIPALQRAWWGVLVWRVLVVDGAQAGREAYGSDYHQPVAWACSTRVVADD